MNVEIVPASLWHAADLVGRMRPHEYATLARLGEPEKVVAQELVKSFQAYAGMIDNKTVALWGAHVSGVFSDEAYIWLICTGLVDQHPITFLRHSKKILHALAPNFRRVYGVVHVDFDKSIRWLEWLGFQVDPAVGPTRRFSRSL